MNIPRILVFILCGLTGCIPYPHFEDAIPKVEGVLTRSHVPLSDVKIFESEKPWDKQCLDHKRVVITEKDGRFFIPPRSEFSLFISMGDPQYIASWCAEVDGIRYRLSGTQEGYSDKSNRTIDLLCDISIDLTTLKPYIKEPVQRCRPRNLATPERKK